MRSLPALGCLGLMLAGCVAPEAPEPPRPAPVAVKPPTPSTAQFDDAPIPNRGVNRAGSDSIVHFAK